MVYDPACASPNQIIQRLLSCNNKSRSWLILIIIGILTDSGYVPGRDPQSFLMLYSHFSAYYFAQIGMDQVQFGVVLILASMIGLLTPPVGMSLYAVCSITNVDLMSLSKAVLPYVVGIFIVLILCAYWPPLSMWIPTLLYG